MYSEKAGELLAVIRKAAKGTPEEHMQAIKLLQAGILMIKTGMDKHMQALKAVTFKQSGAAPAKSVTSKLQAVVDKLQAKVDAELADPSNAHNPIVGIDVQ